MTQTDTANKARADKCKILRDSLIEHATAYEAQIGRICISIRRPSFWLFSSNRHRFYKRPENREWARAVGRGPTRGWLYAWPICIRITDKEGNYE